MIFIHSPIQTEHRSMVKLLTLKERFLGGNPIPFYSFDFHFLVVFHSKKKKGKRRREHRKKEEKEEKEKKMLGTTDCSTPIWPVGCPINKTQKKGVQQTPWSDHGELLWATVKGFDCGDHPTFPHLLFLL